MTIKHHCRNVCCIQVIVLYNAAIAICIHHTHIYFALQYTHKHSQQYELSVYIKKMDEMEGIQNTGTVQCSLIIT